MQLRNVTIGKYYFSITKTFHHFRKMIQKKLEIFCKDFDVKLAPQSERCSYINAPSTFGRTLFQKKDFRNNVVYKELESPEFRSSRSMFTYCILFYIFNRKISQNNVLMRHNTFNSSTINKGFSPAQHRQHLNKTNQLVFVQEKTRKTTMMMTSVLSMFKLALLFLQSLSTRWFRNSFRLSTTTSFNTISPRMDVYVLPTQFIHVG